MNDGPTPRQVLYGIVAGAFHLVVGALAVASSALAPPTWNVVVAVVWVAVAGLVIARWRRTGLVLGVTLGAFAAWTAGAVVVLT